MNDLSVAEKIRNLLFLLHEEWPTEKGIHHNLALDLENFTVCLAVGVEGYWHLFELGEKDFLEPESAIQDIKNYFSKTATEDDLSNKAGTSSRD